MFAKFLIITSLSLGLATSAFAQGANSGGNANNSGSTNSGCKSSQTQQGSAGGPASNSGTGTTNQNC